MPTCYATCSIGHDEPHTPLKHKAIADAGFDAIELSMPGILSHGKMLNSEEPDPKGLRCTGADRGVDQRVGAAAPPEHHNGTAFGNLEGGPGSSERTNAFDRLKGWMRVIEAVGTNMPQVGSSDAPEISLSLDDLARDLTQAADILATNTKHMRIAYDN